MSSENLVILLEKKIKTIRKLLETDWNRFLLTTLIELFIFDSFFETKSLRCFRNETLMN